jgi:hypothetical protein
VKLAAMSSAQIKGAERTLSVGTWAITAGSVLFSVLTVTPLVQRVTPPAWSWTAPILPMVVDAAVVIVVRLDATVSRLGGDGGAWPVVLRWLTGLFTVALNIGESALRGSAVGVAVHVVAPALLIVTAEAGLSYRRAIAKALDRIAGEQAEEAERQRVHEQSEREAREGRQREREQAEREERERERGIEERREREAREHTAQVERERREHEAKTLHDQREYESSQRRDAADRVERQQERERAEREAQQQLERQERERRERSARERGEREQAEREQREKAAREQLDRAARERRERQGVNTAAAAVNTSVQTPVNTAARPVVNSDRMPQEEARQLVVNTPGASVRTLAAATGWSIGWVSKVRSGEAGAEALEEAAA